MIRTADIIAILVFLLGMAGMGLYFARRNRSTEEYFLGNRSFPGWAIGLSMLGTSISSVTFLALPAAAYVLDFRMLTPNLTLPVVAVIAIFVFIPFFRRGKTVSAYEYLESRFGIGVRLYVAIYFVLISSSGWRSSSIWSRFRWRRCAASISSKSSSSAARSSAFTPSSAALKR